MDKFIAELMEYALTPISQTSAVYLHYQCFCLELGYMKKKQIIAEEIKDQIIDRIKNPNLLQKLVEVFIFFYCDAIAVIYLFFLKRILVSSSLSALLIFLWLFAGLLFLLFLSSFGRLKIAKQFLFLF